VSLTLSAHAQEGYSSCSVGLCASVQQISKVTVVQQSKEVQTWRRRWFNPFPVVMKLIYAKIGPRSLIFKTNFSLSYRLHFNQMRPK